MINVTKLLTNIENESDHLRYVSNLGPKAHGVSEGNVPVVVWNMTRSCNLNCIHCYADAELARDPNELSTKEAENFIEDLAKFKTPVLLFSGGEPLTRKDIFHLIKFASERNLRPVISTNGTMITKDVARHLKESGTKYVGISIDGIGKNNDRFRGKAGAFEKAVSGIRNCIEIGQKVGLRFTISEHNYSDLGSIFDLIEKEKIPRACFYHLVYTGRGHDLISSDVKKDDTRKIVDLIISKTLDFHTRGINVEILTVDNHTDGVYIYNWMKERDDSKAERILELLRMNGGNRSGIAIACVDWLGNVHPDQFMRNVTFGNIRDRKFSDIWIDLSHPVLSGLRDRKKLLKGRCGECKWLDICNGNFRARAASNGELWGSDPSCYLTDREIGIN